MDTMTTLDAYYTVLIPYVAPRFATPWHPTTNEGPFATLTRGAFPTQDAAIEWAQSRLNGCPYSLVMIEAV